MTVTIARSKRAHCRPGHDTEADFTRAMQAAIRRNPWQLPTPEPDWSFLDTLPKIKPAPQIGKRETMISELFWGPIFEAVCLVFTALDTMTGKGK